MTAEWDELLSRDELLSGLPARRASTLLFAIESRTAQRVARARQAAVRYRTERSTEEQERDFLQALAQGRDLPVQPTIQDLERYASDWQSLVPDDPRVRAAVARLIGDKYALPEQPVLRLRRALGLDQPEVQAAFEQLHGRSLATIYAHQVPRSERLRWLRTGIADWLENLSPFWTAFALTLTETVGASLLALPIVFARIGPLAAIVVLVVLGLLNMLTIAAMAEAVARNGNVRYGHAFFGRIISDYLGRPGLLILTPVLVIIYVIVLLAYYIGLGVTLADATDIPAELWVAGIFLMGLYFVRRRTLDATVASALVIGAVNISLIVVLAGLALPHLHASYLRYSEAPLVTDASFSGDVIALIFGVALLAFAGHTSTGYSAGVVLERDPSGRSFILGCAAAMLCALGLNVLWILAVNGSVEPEALANESGTSLTPLAHVAGGAVYIFGTLFAICSMGMGSIHMALGLFNLVRERIPASGDARGLGRGDLIRFLISAAPLVALFVLVEGLFLTDAESFAGPLGFMGVIIGPLIGGVFPVLMLVAARRKGDCPVGMAWQVLDHPLVAGGIYLLFIASIILHGLVIWNEPAQQAAALLAALIVLAMTVVVIRRGAFTPRTVVELRVNRAAGDETFVAISARGKLQPAAVAVSYADGRAEAQPSDGALRIPALIHAATIKQLLVVTPELKVWAHQQTRESTWTALPATASLRNGSMAETFDLRATNGEVVVPVADGAHTLEITLL